MNKQRILCYGDSNTWGHAADGSGRYADDVRWPGVLAAELGDGFTILEEALPGRTTVFTDPLEPFRNGRDYLLPCLLSHRPLDIVVLMLGTNDLKARFSATPSDIAQGAGLLLDIIAKSATGRNEQAPKMLLVCPPPLADSIYDDDQYDNAWQGGLEKSKRLPVYFAQTAREHNVPLLTAGQFIETSPLDSVHFTEETQATLGKVIATAVRDLLR